MSPTRFGLNPLKSSGGFVVCLIGLSILFSVFVILKDSIPNSIWVLNMASLRVLDQEEGPSESFRKHNKKLHSSGLDHTDNLLGGLISDRFDEKACLSRYQAASYRKKSPYKPSSYLISKLRKYEALHKRCGPHTESYNKTVSILRSGQTIKENSGCNYLVWLSCCGLGNQILSLASTFLYALLTDRVLLVPHGFDLVDMLCEPFPDASWLLPLDFPITKPLYHLNQKSPESFGNMLKNSNNSSSYVYVYVHIGFDSDDYDYLFFCDQDQSFLQNVSWVILRSNEYFVPSLFLMHSFEKELIKLFPEMETVFHFLGRYLLSPTDLVWGLVTRYYQAYLAEADERIGVQIRVFDTQPGPFQYVLNQILSCLIKNNLIPDINKNENGSFITTQENKKTKAILVTSLSSWYFEKIRDMYWEHSSLTGETVRVFQPSHEEYQQTGKKMHDHKVWAEMYLLSLTDKLITSSWSTFGYVAQGLGGLNPWIFFKPQNETTTDPTCTRAVSMEPCFHSPPSFDCKSRTRVDNGFVVPHVRHCQDAGQGLKLVNPMVKDVA